MLGLVGLALLGIALLLSPGGASGTVRTVAGCLAILVVPAWLVGRLADEDSDAIARAAGGVVATLALCALCGFVSFELGLRVATAVFAVPLLVLVAAAALLGSTSPRVSRAPLAPLAGALVLGVVALLGALGTHLALPAVPVQGAFSIRATQASASASDVYVRVTVTRVRTDDPLALALWVGSTAPGSSVVTWTRIGVHKVNAGPHVLVALRAALPTHTDACPLVRVVPFSGANSKANGAFLTPPVRCGG
ncbi:MAG TPA: hypothetical protein VGZ33_07400 [Acidimicrobiales bacterium]|nr:hypothetical protein [Acidimicrobiales bacterium]